MKQWLIVGLVVLVLLGSYLWNRNRNPQLQGEDLPSVEEVIVKEDGQVVKKVGGVEEVLSEEEATAMKAEIEGKVAGVEAIALAPTTGGRGNGTSSVVVSDGTYYQKVIVSDVQPAQKGYFYEVWLENAEGSRVSIGRLEMQDTEGQLLYSSSEDRSTYDKYAVSYEVEDGNPERGEVYLEGMIEELETTNEL